MKNIKAIDRPVNVPHGAFVRLDADQYKTRSHNLSKTDSEGVYFVEDRIQFKVGETFGCSGGLSKAGEIQVPEKAAEKIKVPRQSKKKTSKK